MLAPQERSRQVGATISAPASPGPRRCPPPMVQNTRTLSAAAVQAVNSSMVDRRVSSASSSSWIPRAAMQVPQTPTSPPSGSPSRACAGDCNSLGGPSVPTSRRLRHRRGGTPGPSAFLPCERTSQAQSVVRPLGSVGRIVQDQQHLHIHFSRRVSAPGRRPRGL
jgi:hypothetical protein